MASMDQNVAIPQAPDENSYIPIISAMSDFQLL